MILYDIIIFKTNWFISRYCLTTDTVCVLFIVTLGFPNILLHAFVYPRITSYLLQSETGNQVN